MASGYGLNGGPSRCFPFWQEVLACYVVNASGSDSKATGKCGPALDDYYECLHHKKEVARAKQMQAAYNKYLQKNPRDDAPSAKEIRSLGLLDAKPEEKNIKVSKFIPQSKHANTLA